jgi:RNA polymerase sigma-70 factor (ECF subfamily)
MTDEPERSTSELAAHPPPSEAVDAEKRQEEFSAFYREFTAKLIGFLILQGARAPDAADIVQTTMIKAWNSWSTIDSPRAWARVVASRELVRRLTDLEEEDTATTSEWSALLLSSSDIDDWVACDEYYQALAALPPRQRQAVVWTMEGYTSSEIAEQLPPLNAATVRSNLRKARRNLARRLSGGANR